jgi:drug/metabolite transporter (DMT)-like permease
MSGPAVGENSDDAELRRIRRGGWIEAVLFCLSIAAISIAYAVAIRWQVNVVVFILYSLLLSSIALVMLTGRRNDLAGLLATPLTWVVGLGTVVVEVVFFLMLLEVAPADGSLLARLSVPLAPVLGYLLFRLPQPPVVWIGCVIVISGVAPLIWSHLALGHNLGVACGVLASVIFVLRGFASEAHPANRPGHSIMDRLAVTASILLVTTAASIVLVGGLALAVAAGLLPASPLVPRPSELWHLPTLLLALLSGAAILTAMNYLAFSSAAKIGTSRFVAAGAFIPVVTLLAQTVAASVGIIEAPPVTWNVLVAAGIVVAGVLIMLSPGRGQNAA